MANDPSVNVSPPSPIEGKAEAAKHFRKLQHRLFWLHPTGLVVAIIAAGGDPHKLRMYGKYALMVSIAAHIILLLQMISVSRMYKGHKS